MDNDGGGSEIETGSARFERHKKDMAVRIILEVIHHHCAARDTYPAVQELRFPTGLFRDPPLQQFSHFPVLRKDENFSSVFTALIKQFKKCFRLGAVRCLRPLFVVLRGRIADLLQLRDELENQRPALHLLIAAVRLSTADRIQISRESFLVEIRLLGEQRRHNILHNAVGQIADNRFIGLHTAKHEGGDKLSESLGRPGIMFVLNRNREIFPEVGRRAEKPWLHNREN